MNGKSRLEHLEKAWKLYNSQKERPETPNDHNGSKVWANPIGMGISEHRTKAYKNTIQRYHDFVTATLDQSYPPLVASTRKFRGRDRAPYRPSAPQSRAQNEILPIPWYNLCSVPIPLSDPLKRSSSSGCSDVIALDCWCSSSDYDGKCGFHA